MEAEYFHSHSRVESEREEEHKDRRLHPVRGGNEDDEEEEKQAHENGAPREEPRERGVEEERREREDGELEHEDDAAHGLGSAMIRAIHGNEHGEPQRLEAVRAVDAVEGEPTPRARVLGDLEIVRGVVGHEREHALHACPQNEERHEEKRGGYDHIGYF